MPGPCCILCSDCAWVWEEEGLEARRGSLLKPHKMRVEQRQWGSGVRLLTSII